METLPLWKEAQQEVRQHWFIDSYIAAYIQVQYRVIGEHPTGLTVDQGCRQVSASYSTAKRYARNCGSEALMLWT